MYLMVQIGQHPCNTYVNCTTPPAAGVRNCTKPTNPQTQVKFVINYILEKK